jgi:UDP-2,3-diacylglucosamine hydrolase
MPHAPRPLLMLSPFLFISDLHLDGARAEVTDQFLLFLRTEARIAKALYILGDLFETWIGDDDPDADKRRIQAALLELTNSGVPCYVMHGNRDFLIGRKFCKATGCTLVDEGTIIDLNGRRALLLHGDTLCTDDHDYQRLRRIVRNPFVKLIFRIMSLRQRQTLADKIRAGSQAHTRQSMAQIMDVNPQAVLREFKKHGVDLMIHGHTHRPAIHTLTLDGKPATRIVLGDWYEQGSVLHWDHQTHELRNLKRAELAR